MSEHDDAGDLQDLDAEFQRRARAVMARVGTIERHERGDVAHDEQFARHGAEYRLRIDARIRAGDDHRLRALPPMRERLVARPLARPNFGAKAAIAVDERVHGALAWKAVRAECCTAIRRRRGRRNWPCFRQTSSMRRPLRRCRPRTILPP